MHALASACGVCAEFAQLHDLTRCMLALLDVCSDALSESRTEDSVKAHHPMTSWTHAEQMLSFLSTLCSASSTGILDFDTMQHRDL